MSSNKPCHVLANLLDPPKATHHVGGEKIYIEKSGELQLKGEGKVREGL